MENVYESEALLGQYLHFHYASAADFLPYSGNGVPSGALDFPRRCVTELFPWGEISPEARALDVGCAVGRASFELSARCAEVVGVDFSRGFVDAARELARRGECEYSMVAEGDRLARYRAQLPEGARAERVKFVVGDAQDLPDEWRGFEVVLAANLLCRLSQPQRFLERVPSLVAVGGYLGLTTPCTWMEEFTPRESWLGGVEQATLESLQMALETYFELLEVVDMPFLIREHARKYQWTVAQGSLWRRREGEA